MFDIGWQELFVIGLVAIIVVGPKDLPRVLRAVTLGIRKIRGMARDFQDGIDELAREAELQELRKEIEQVSTADLEKEFESIADPAREVEQSVREISGSINEPDDAVEAPKPAAAPVETARETPETPSTGARKAGDAS